ncbi:hypothetical protein PI126_g12651 [Phytophthora idaei]|nr:hypothetical protein PI126_g12651 [Phytophthora idaei]
MSVHFDRRARCGTQCGATHFWTCSRFPGSSASSDSRSSATPMPQVARLPRKHQVIQLRRSGVHKCYCQAAPLTKLHNALLPSTMNVVQLARLHKVREFLKFDHPSIKRVMLELVLDTLGDAVEYERFREYLIKGRENQPRAGVALEMESQGYKVFILPPGQETQWLGYRGDMMVAVIRSSW